VTTLDQTSQAADHQPLTDKSNIQPLPDAALTHP